MMRHVTVRKVGGSPGATPPKEVVDRFHVEADVVTTIVALAAGEMGEARLATWVRKTMIKRKRGSS